MILCYFRYDELYPSLISMTFSDDNYSLRLVYDSLRLLVILGNDLTKSFPSFSLQLQDYRKERVALTNLHYSTLSNYKSLFDNVLFHHFNTELEKPNPEETQLLTIVNWWKSYSLKPIIEEYRSSFKSFHASNVCDVPSAKKYALSFQIDKLLRNYKSGAPVVKEQARKDYAQKHIAEVFGFPSTLEALFYDFFTPSDFIPVPQAVLSTKPRPLKWKENSCFASSYFQCVANFFPLFQRLPGKDHIGNGPIIKQHIDIMQKVAQPVQDPLSVMDLLSWPNNSSGDFPLRMLVRFLYDTGSEELVFNKIIGKISISEDLKQESYFPPHRFFTCTSGFPEIHRVRMIGQLFIVYLSAGCNVSYTEERFFDPIEMPLSVNLKVTDSDQLKRFELYSFIMGRGLHAIAYVRRADDQWWHCDDVDSRIEMVSEEKLPNTKQKQSSISSKQRPLAAFYLRVEA